MEEKGEIKNSQGTQRRKIGLALSGGGFRAAAFHLGTLKRLHKLDVLNEIDVISTISGGSIAGVYYALKHKDFEDFVLSFETGLQKNVILRIIFSFRFLSPLFILFLLTGAVWYISSSLSWTLLTFFILVIVLLSCLFIFVPLSSLVEGAYRKLFFGKKTISELPERPLMAINATNLDTGTLMTFSRTRIEDSTYRYSKEPGKYIIIKPDIFPCAKAVAASTAVPYPFNPVRIGRKYFADKGDYKLVNFSLVDGGVYDNQGIHKITQHNSSYKCDIVICSDGSSVFKKSFSGINPLPVLGRVMNVMMRRIKNLQFISNVYDVSSGNVSEIAYFSLDWDYEGCIKGFCDAIKNGTLREEVLLSHNIPKEFLGGPGGRGIMEEKISEYIKSRIGFNDIVQYGLSQEQIKEICTVGTNLTSLSKQVIDMLSRHAETLTEIQVKLYCPGLLAQ